MRIEADPTLPTLLAPAPSQPRRDAAIVLGLLLVVTLFNLAIDNYTSLTSEAMGYVLAIVVASYAVSRAAAVLGAIGAVLCLNFFFIEPRHTLQVEAQENAAALLALLVLALVISHLAAKSRREAELARLNEQRARHLQALASALAASKSPEQVIAFAQRSLDHAFTGPCFVALAAPDGEVQLPPERQALRDGMRACVRESAVVGPGTGRWPGLDAWYLPLQSERFVGGAAHVANAQAGDHAGREHAQAICALAGQALQRIALADSVNTAEATSRWHQAQNTFLAAISHDFRTPLAAIMAAASSLDVQRHKLPAGEQDRLLQSIVAEAGHLATLTENTLQLVRLESKADLAFDWQSVEEIVGSVLARVRARDPERRIHADVPAGLPLIKGDSVLLAQLLENLLDNALKYSADTIELSAGNDASGIFLGVHDRGAGITHEDAQTLFDPFRRGDHSGKRGTGLGLAVCRAIAQAHGGELRHEPREGGGSSFLLRLPAPPQQAVPEAR